MKDRVQSVSSNFEVLARTGIGFGEQELAYVLQNFIAVETRRFRVLPDCPLVRRVRRVSQRYPFCLPAASPVASRWKKNGYKNPVWAFFNW